jgi:hypothetical protein
MLPAPCRAGYSSSRTRTRHRRHVPSPASAGGRALARAGSSPASSSSSPQATALCGPLFGSQPTSAGRLHHPVAAWPEETPSELPRQSPADGERGRERESVRSSPPSGSIVALQPEPSWCPSRAGHYDWRAHAPSCHALSSADTASCVTRPIEARALPAGPPELPRAILPRPAGGSAAQQHGEPARVRKRVAELSRAIHPLRHGQHRRAA